jgi:hypothetical protein
MRQSAGGRSEGGNALTYVIHGLLGRHVLRRAREDVDLVVLREESAAQLGKVADENARVQLAQKEVLPGVLKQRLAEALKAYALVDVA